MSKRKTTDPEAAGTALILADAAKNKKEGRHVPTLPDGVRPHDTVTYAGLIQMGLIKQLPQPKPEA